MAFVTSPSPMHFDFGSTINTFSWNFPMNFDYGHIYNPTPMNFEYEDSVENKFEPTHMVFNYYISQYMNYIQGILN